MAGPAQCDVLAEAVAGVLVLLAGAGWLTLVWASAEDGAAEADPQASVLGVVLAAAGAGAALLHDGPHPTLSARRAR